jgi:hypothetical protein
MMKALAGPYDVIKLDVEGSEYDFIEHYESVWTQATSLIIECHDSAARGFGWREGADWIASATKFRVLNLIAPAGDCGQGTGLLLLTQT